MVEKYFHIDKFEIFGEAYHRAILLVSDDVLSDFKLQLASIKVKADGFFYKKLCLSILSEPDFKGIKVFDIDAEPDACIICHADLTELNAIIDKMQDVFIEKNISEEYIKGISNFVEIKEENEFGF